MKEILKLDHIQKYYGNGGNVTKAIQDISFSVQEGEFVGIMGASGSGKTTLLNCISTIDTVSAGHIYLDGVDLLALSPAEMRKMRGSRISMIFQDALSSLNPVFTVGSQICEPLMIHQGLNRRQAMEKAVELLKLVNIPAPERRVLQYPHELSGGMRQRVMIAIALACEPKLLIADEPTTALDVTIQAQILELMMELKDKLGMAIIMITHDLGIVASMCDRIAVMYAGRIVETGTCDEIFYHPKHEYTKGLLESIPRLDSTKHEKLIPIEGNPVDLLNPPEGCEFAPRCKNCMKICLRENPPKTDFSETHYAHCFMNQKAEMEGGNTNE